MRSGLLGRPHNHMQTRAQSSRCERHACQERRTQLLRKRTATTTLRHGTRATAAIFCDSTNNDGRWRSRVSYFLFGLWQSACFAMEDLCRAVPLSIAPSAAAPSKTPKTPTKPFLQTTGFLMFLCRPGSMGKLATFRGAAVPPPRERKDRQSRVVRTTKRPSAHSPLFWRGKNKPGVALRRLSTANSDF